MAHSRYLRQMARSLRAEQQLTVDELAERLALPRSTIYYWVRDLPLQASRAGDDARSAGAGEGTDDRAGSVEATRKRAPRAPSRAQRVSRVRRDAAYEEGLRSFEELTAQPTFRDFVCVYMLQGYKRDRTRIELSNSDPAVMRLASRWIRRLTDRVPIFSVRHEAEQSLNELRRFWGEAIGADARSIRVRAAVAGKVGEAHGAPDEVTGPGPSRLRHGVLTVAVEDTLLRARLQAWMHRTRETWL